MKKCSKCWEEKVLGEFTKDKRRPDWRGSHCYKCHRVRNNNYNADNKEVKKAREKIYRENNKEKEAARHKKYQQNNKDKINKYLKVYRERKWEVIKMNMREWRANNKDRDKANQSSHYERYKDRKKTLAKARMKKFPELFILKDWLRRQRARNQTIDNASKEDFKMITTLRGLMQEIFWEPYHIDHRVPLSKWWLHHPINLQVITATDNLRKGAKLQHSS